MVLTSIPVGGYLYSLRSGVFYIDLWDRAADAPGGRPHPAELELLDAVGGILAVARTEGRYHTVLLEHPTLGVCSPELSPEQWRACFRALSRWIATWGDQVDRVRIRAAGCELEATPSRFSRRTANVFTWWVPHPHIGGRPYTLFSLGLRFDSSRCEVVASTARNPRRPSFVGRLPSDSGRLAGLDRVALASASSEGS